MTQVLSNTVFLDIYMCPPPTTIYVSYYCVLLVEGHIYLLYMCPPPTTACVLNSYYYYTQVGGYYMCLRVSPLILYSEPSL